MRQLRKFPIGPYFYLTNLMSFLSNAVIVYFLVRVYQRIWVSTNNLIAIVSLVTLAILLQFLLKMVGTYILQWLELGNPSVQEKRVRFYTDMFWNVIFALVFLCILYWLGY